MTTIEALVAIGTSSALFAWFGRLTERRKIAADATKTSSESELLKQQTNTELLHSFRELMAETERIHASLRKSEEDKLALLRQSEADKAELHSTINDLKLKLESAQTRQTSGLRTLREDVERMTQRQTDILEMLTRMEAQQH